LTRDPSGRLVWLVDFFFVADDMVMACDVRCDVMLGRDLFLPRHLIYNYALSLLDG
jgi:hypothetical protein